MAVASVILAISSAPFSCSVSSAVAHGCQLTTTPTACGTSCCPSSTFYTSSIYTSISTTCSSSDAGSKYTTIRFFASRTSVEEFNASTVFEKIVGRGTTSAATSKSDAFLPDVSAAYRAYHPLLPLTFLATIFLPTRGPRLVSIKVGQAKKTKTDVTCRQ